MQEIQLTITIEEANQILEALGNQPFKTVFQLIGKIQQQAAGQISPNNRTANERPDDLTLKSASPED